ncbi:MAG: hypothetical protein CMJ20_04665 [Phycisphaeraceae bacterium]|nr:hypothetical protein [Phycisphaeraceae bacterium]
MELRRLIASYPGPIISSINMTRLNSNQFESALGPTGTKVFTVIATIPPRSAQHTASVAKFQVHSRAIFQHANARFTPIPTDCFHVPLVAAAAAP